MRNLGSACNAVLLLVAMASICGCGGVHALGTVPAMATTVPQAHSWMLKGATSGPLLYVTGEGGVYVVSYPQGKLVGQLAGVVSPQGVCADSHGNVFVTAYLTEDVLEFAHGGTTPIAKLGDYGYYPNGCAIDPKTGNLAVANTSNMEFGPGNVAIYKQAQGKPTDYGLGNFYWCAYDGRGNLLLGGSGGGYEYMPAGSYNLEFLTLSVPGQGIHWDGRYFAIIDPKDKQVDQVSISGSRGTVVNKINITGLIASLGYDFALSGSKIVLPYTLKKSGFISKIATARYPQGGRLARPFKIGGNDYYTMALSI